MASASTSVCEKPGPSAVTSKPGNSVPPYMSLMSLLSCYPTTGVQKVLTQVNPCMGLLRKHLWPQESSVSLSHNPCWLSQPEVWGLPFSTLKPLTGGLGVGLGLLAPWEGSLQWRYLSQFLSATDFWLFSTMVVLMFSCNSDVVFGGYEYHVYLSWPLDWNTAVFLFPVGKQAHSSYGVAKSEFKGRSLWFQSLCVFCFFVIFFLHHSSLLNELLLGLLLMTTFWWGE